MVQNTNIDPKTGKPYVSNSSDTRTAAQKADDDAGRPRSDGTVSQSGKPYPQRGSE